jgi:DNA processing protein
MVSVIDLLILSQIPSVGPQRLRLLVAHFDGPERILTGSPKDFIGVEGFTRKLASTVASFLRSSSLHRAREFASRQLSRLNACGGSIVSYWDGKYPEALRRIYDPPTLLFTLGEFVPDDQYALAVVGTRSPSPYGTSIAGRLTAELSRRGLCVVSGLARGIDTTAHTASLAAGGRTLAVIGSGIDVVYPPENRKLAERISRRGVLISEYPMGTKPDAGNFPRRNRIISGLSLGTIVIETDMNGGALITAASALDQNREVFAVPGPVGARQSCGCNVLIKTGRAKLVESVEDILTELRLPARYTSGIDGGKKKEEVEVTLFEQTVLHALRAGPLHVDEISLKAGMATSDTLVYLLGLEFKGLVTQLPGKFFTCT